MSCEQVTHTRFEGHPYTHLFSSPAGAVIFRVDAMQQVVCSPRGAELARAALSGERSPEALPAQVREVLWGEPADPPVAPEGAGGPARDYTHTLYLMPTLDCQLRCGYCRITRRPGRQAGWQMTPEFARAAVDRVFAQGTSQGRRTVVFFGGEPLLARDTVLSAITHIRAGPERDNTDITLQTNGIAVDEVTAEFLAANDVFVLASIDGVREVHDSHRRFSTGEGSYEASVAGYHRAKRAGCRVGISATLTAETAEGFVESFEEMLDGLAPDECGVGTHLHPLASGRSPHQASPEAAAHVLTATYAAARQRGVFHQQMCQRLEPIVKGTWRRYACAGCAGKVVVAPNGEAGVCEYNASEGRSYVPLDEFSPDTAPDLTRWAGRSPLNVRECLACPALPTCGGGCAYDSQEILGDALRFDPWLCETNVRIVGWAMQDLFAHLQGRLRDGDFHVVTPQERAGLLGRISLDRRTPGPRVADGDRCLAG